MRIQSEFPHHPGGFPPDPRGISLSPLGRDPAQGKQTHGGGVRGRRGWNPPGDLVFVGRFTPRSLIFFGTAFFTFANPPEVGAASLILVATSLYCSSLSSHDLSTFHPLTVAGRVKGTIKTLPCPPPTRTLRDLHVRL